MDNSRRWQPTPFDVRSMDPEVRARCCLNEIMPPTYGELLRRVTKAITEAEMSKTEIGT